MISVDDTAPDFTLYGHDMEAHTLSEALTAGPVLLLFFPGAFTSVCTNELNSVNNELEDFGGEAITVFGISTDSPFVLKEFSQVHKFQFPLLSDHEGAAAASYGAKYDHNFTSMELDRIAKRAAFVIRPDQTVAYAEVLENAGAMPNFKEVKQTIRGLLS